MVERASFAKGNPHHLALGLLCRFPDRFRHLFGLALAEANAAFLVANHHKGGEAKALTAFNGLRDAVYRNKAICKFWGLVAVAAASVSWFSCHSGGPFHAGRSLSNPTLFCPTLVQEHPARIIERARAAPFA